MTDQQHPITPPDELRAQWIKEWRAFRPSFTTLEQWLAKKAARWGADQELEACCEWIGSEGLAGYTSRELRAARRPKPKSQAEEALTALDDAVIGGHIITTSTAAPTIRAALERLRELEGSND
jgi:hypothetical protein